MLSAYEKRVLDKNILKILQKNNQSVTVKEIRKIGKLDYTSTSIIASLKRLIKQEYPIIISLDCNSVKNYIYDNNALVQITDKIDKQKNLLYFHTNNTFYFNFFDSSFNVDLKNIHANKNFLEKILFIQKNGVKYEWVFNYTNSFIGTLRIIDYCIQNNIEKMPNGLYPYLKERCEVGEKNFTADILDDFMTYQKYGKKYYKTIVYCIHEIRSSYVPYFKMFLDKFGFEKLLKIYQNNFLNGHCLTDNFIRNCEYLLQAVLATKEQTDLSIQEIFNLIDFNRDIRFNNKKILNIANIEKNKKLSRVMQKLNFINNIKDDNLIIVVPQTQEEKMAEGQMQNNCVGYYYDKNILAGKDLIYFIRKIQNSNHSYITCRYNISLKQTVEYRTKNNQNVTDKKALDFIKNIDTIINNHLKEVQQ